MEIKIVLDLGDQMRMGIRDFDGFLNENVELGADFGFEERGL